ncbi:MAG TPA: adenylyl-sulfate kinase [Planctomycetota bacterium]
MAFAVWLTGPPGAGKSTIADALFRRGLKAARLESDVLRSVLMPKAGYGEEDRETFYGAMLWIGNLLVEHGVSVVFDATAARRAWRDRARQSIARFLEVFVDCPRDVLAARDPKGLYKAAAEGRVTALPGAQTPYEPPLLPELVVRSDRESADAAADRILLLLRARGWL